MIKAIFHSFLVRILVGNKLGKVTSYLSEQTSPTWSSLVAANCNDEILNAGYDANTVWKLCYTGPPTQNFAYYKVDMGAVKTVNSVLFSDREECCTTTPYDIYVGNDAVTANANTLCTTVTASGWFQCTAPTVGRYFYVYLSTQTILNFYEVMAFEPYFVQHNFQSATLSDIYPGSSPNNALIKNGFKIGLSIITSGASTNIITPAWYKIDFKAEFKMKQAVIVIVYNNGLYSTFISVYSTDRYGVETYCGIKNDPNGGDNPEVYCNRPALSVRLSAPSLSLASVGIMSDCLCTDTTFNKDALPTFINPTLNALELTRGGPQNLTGFIPYDSVSLVCGNADGLSHCGARTVNFYQNGVLELNLITYDDATKTIIVPPVEDPGLAGDYIFTIGITLSSYLINSADTVQGSIALTIIDPCMSTVIDPWIESFTNQTVSFGQSVEFTLTEPADQVSKAYGDQSGYNFCGDRLLYVVDQNGQANSQWKYTAQTLTVTPTKDDQQFTLYLSFGLQKYSQIELSGPIALTVTVPKLPLFSPPFFTSGPSSSYTLLKSKLELLFTIVDDQLDEYAVDVSIDRKFKSASYSVDYGDITTVRFTFLNSTDLRPGTYKMTITITQNDWSKVTSFDVVIPAPAILKQILEEPPKQDNKTVASYQPSNETSPVIQIANITNLGVITIVSNQNVTYENSTLLVSFVQNSYEPPIQFNFTLVSQTNTSLVIQCNFSKPLSVSVYKIADQAVITFQYSQQAGQTWTRLQGDFPMMLSSAAEVKTLTQISDTLGSASSTIFWIYLVVNICFGFALGMLWGTFQTLQVITALPLLQVRMPPNVLMIFAGFNDIINMKIIDPQALYQATLGKVVPDSRRLQSNDTITNSTTEGVQQKSSGSIVADMMLLAMGVSALLIVVAIVIFCVKKVYPLVPKKIQNLILAVKRKIMWSSALRYTTQSYLAQAIMCTATIAHLQSQTLIQQIVAPLTFIYLLTWPLCIYFILKRNKNTLNTQETKASLGSLYMNYETDKHSCMTYTMWFMYRRLLIACVISFMQVSIVMQAIFTINSSLVLLTFLATWKPMEANHYNYLAVFNEFVLLVACYLMFLFTDFVPDPALRFEFGKYFLYLLYANLATNLLVLGFEISKMSHRSCKRWLKIRKWRQRKAVQVAQRKLLIEKRLQAIIERNKIQALRNIVERYTPSEYENKVIVKNTSTQQQQNLVTTTLAGPEESRTNEVKGLRQKRVVRQKRRLIRRESSLSIHLGSSFDSQQQADRLLSLDHHQNPYQRQTNSPPPSIEISLNSVDQIIDEEMKRNNL